MGVFYYFLGMHKVSKKINLFWTEGVRDISPCRPRPRRNRLAAVAHSGRRAHSDQIPPSASRRVATTRRAARGRAAPLLSHPHHTKRNAPHASPPRAHPRMIFSPLSPQPREDRDQHERARADADAAARAPQPAPRRVAVCHRARGAASWWSGQSAPRLAAASIQVSDHHPLFAAFDRVCHVLILQTFSAWPLYHFCSSKSSGFCLNF